MPLTDNNYYCVRCGAGHEWGVMTSTPEGNLFCPSCWKQLKTEVKRKCPVDGAEMQKRLVADVIQLDVCPTCQGTWFDKSELEVVLKKSKDEGWYEAFVLGWILG
jgi:predicted amidophosphoribosyltransferase